VNVIKCRNIFPGNVFCSSIVTIANGKAIDRLCSDAQCSLTTTTWHTSYFSYFFDDKIFIVCSGIGKF